MWWYIDNNKIREAIKDSRRLVGILQGIISLEGQGLNRKTYREMKRKILLKLLYNRKISNV